MKIWLWGDREEEATCSPTLLSFHRILITVHFPQYLHLYLRLKDNGNEHLVTLVFEGVSVLGGFILRYVWNAPDHGRANEKSHFMSFNTMSQHCS